MPTDKRLVLGEVSIPLYQKFPFEDASGYVSEVGINQIKNTLVYHIGDKGYWIPEDFEWSWKTKRGTLPKRLSAHFWKEHGIKLTQEAMEQIGNLGRTHASEGRKYYYDITDQFDWNMGDFGDSGSCFWGSREDARYMLSDNGGLAFRLWDFEDENYGLARCWLVPVDEKYAIIFNGYSRQGRQTVHLARILATITGYTYRKIDYLCNYGSDCGMLYINGGVGYAIGPQAVVENLDRYDFRWDEPNYPECDHCDRSIRDEDDVVEHNGYTYCQECFDHLFAECYCCGDYVHRDDTHYYDGEYYCDDCFEERFFVCDHCDEVHLLEERNDVDGYGDICNDCIEHYFHCPTCDTWRRAVTRVNDEECVYCSRQRRTDRVAIPF